LGNLSQACHGETTACRGGAFWEGDGLGVATAGVDDHELWGHVGTVAVAWNDDVIDSDGQILPELVRAALGDYQR
jgi:hypothetical protein